MQKLQGQRVKELADELGYDKQTLVTRINELDLGFSVDNFMSRLGESEVEALKEALDEADEGGNEVDDDVDDGIGPTTIRSSGSDTPEPESVESSPGVSSREPDTTSSDEKAVAEADEADEDDTGSGSTSAGVAGIESTGEARPDTVRDRAGSATVEVPDQEEPEVETETAERDEESADVEVDETSEDETLDETPPEVEAEADTDEEVEEPPTDEADVDDQPEQADVDDESDEDDEVEVESDEHEEDEASETTEEAEEEDADEVEAKSTSDDDTGSKRTPEQEAPSSPEDDSASTSEPSSDEPDAVPNIADEEEEDGARVVGEISQNVIKDRLEAEGKEFEEEEEEDDDQENEQMSDHRRRVVEGDDLYDEDSRNRSRGSDQDQQQQQTEITQAAEHKRVIEMEDVISVSELAEEMGAKAGEVAMKLMESGMQATANTSLDYETATLIAEEFGYQVENTAFDITEFYDTSPDPEEQRESRPPVVTVMGHVDHGKTTLLDAIRESDVADEEHGGITQHIGAYQVHTDEDDKVTFIDTPGHEAFTALRARGAKATDLVVLVVAADDGVMPQTVEAINHAQDADVPILVAVNKIDKPTANPDRVKQALTEYELVPEAWGGTTLYEEISAKQKTNIDELLDSIQVQSELEQFTSNPGRRAQGIVIESELDVGRGPVASVLVQRGTLHQSDMIVSGQYHGRARTMHNDRGREIDEAGPSQPVEITGLDGVPEAGEPFFVVESESDAQRITEHVGEQRRKEDMATRAKEVTGSVEDLSAMIREGELKELKVIIKGDVQGSVEALKEAFDSLGNDEVQVKVIHSGVGSVTENDVNLAASSETAAVIVGFNVRPDQRAKEIAEKQGVDILTHSVIYDAIDQIKKILEGLLEPIVEERVLGEVEVRELFESAKAGTIAGCYVTDGEVRRNANARLVRDGRVVYDTDIASLKRYEEDVNEVREGYECGISLEGYNDIKIGDTIEVYDHQEITPTLN